MWSCRRSAIFRTELQVLQLVSIRLPNEQIEEDKFTNNTAEMKVFNFVHYYCTTRLME